jgi:hypothetical protein
MLNPLIHYELDMAHQYQGQLRRRAALWEAAHLAARSARAPRFARPRLRQKAVMLTVILFGLGASALQLMHW